MNISVKNISNNPIYLFVKKDGVDERVVILEGHSIVVDNYETKTMAIYKRKNIIEVREAQLFESNSFAYLGPSQEVEMDEPEESTILNIEENKEGDLGDIEYLRENLLKSLTSIPTSLEIVEGEVEQYIEDGYIKGEWTSEDVIFLKKNYPVKGRKLCSIELNRNETSVQKKINALGLKKKKKKK